MKNLQSYEASFVALFALAWLGTAPANLDAASIIVTNATDSGTGTLRQALASAANGDIIKFSLAAPAIIILTRGELLVSKSVTISGPGAAGLAVSGNHVSRLFHIAANIVVSISDLTLTNGNATSSGGAIWNDHATLSLSRCALLGNSAPGNLGGGIFNDGSVKGSANLTLTDSTVSGNSADYGGGIFNTGYKGSASLHILNSTVRDNSALVGAGIDNFGELGGSASLELINSTVSGNSATGSSGGGIFSDGSSSGSANLRVVNCTLSGNSTVGGGGAIVNDGSSSGHASLDLENSTLSGNSAENGGGGVFNNGTGGSATLEIGNTILKAGVLGGNLFNFSGTVTSHGYNLSSDYGSGFLTATGDQINTDPLLGPLQDNGGLTFTHALLPGSAAINAGNPNPAAPPDTDQRGPGFPRVVACRIDIGAFESPSTTYTVINTQNDGPGSLRQAILDANLCPGANLIQFAPSAQGKILLTSGELLVTGDLIINGPGARYLAVDGNAASRVFRIGPNAVVSISDLTITNGYSPDRGGGIRNDHATLTVRNCTVIGNSTDYAGGGIFSDGEFSGNASLTVSDCTLSGNSAYSYGGGIFNNGYYGNVSLQITGTTLSDNWAYYGGGGGVWNGGVGGTGNLQIANSTLTDNSAYFADGGAIVNDGHSGSASLQIVNSTLSGNSTGFTCGGIYNWGQSGSASLQIGSTILNAAALGANILNNVGTVTSLGYNLSSDDAAGFLNTATDQVNTDPLLGPLQDNGGPTFTHALQPCSPAIDQGKGFSGSASDQRGVVFVRTFDDPVSANATGGDGTDIGAFEAQGHLIDSTPPSITCPFSITVDFTSESGAVVTYPVVATDRCDPNPAVTCVPASGSAFSIGTTDIECTARDATGNASSCSFSVTVLGARGANETLLADFIALRATVTNQDDGRKLDQAIGHLTQSLATELWADQSHLERKHGDRVFQEEKETVKNLCELIKSKKSSIPDGVLQQFIDRIFRADRLLASVAIQEAIAAGVSAKKIEQARKLVAKGDGAAADDKCDNGLEDYRNAWQHAIRAKVSPPTHMANGHLQLEILGEPGEQFVIQVSSDLTVWVNVGTYTADAEGVVTFEDAEASRHAVRYYRSLSH